MRFNTLHHVDLIFAMRSHGQKSVHGAQFVRPSVIRKTRKISIAQNLSYLNLCSQTDEKI